jgi:hypothetical protein
VYRLARGAVVDNGALIAVGVTIFILLWNLLLCNSRVDLMSSGVAVWWTLLCAIGVLNLCGWQRTATILARRETTLAASLRRFERWQLVLSAVFVLACAFRSVFPRGDVQRIGLVDTWLSNVLVGRSVATVAELCFMAQWALVLFRVSRAAGSRTGVAIAWSVVPLIGVAEVCSWYAILTTCYLGNAIEESLWTLTAALLIAGCLAVRSRGRCLRQPFLAAVLALGVMYILFMCTVDIPMYVSRWRADVADGRQYLSLEQGVYDAWSRRTVTFDWEEWRSEIPWMTLYFSACVWWSLALVHSHRYLQPIPKLTSCPAPGSTLPLPRRLIAS